MWEHRSVLGYEEEERKRSLNFEPRVVTVSSRQFLQTTLIHYTLLLLPKLIPEKCYLSFVQIYGLEGMNCSVEWELSESWSILLLRRQIRMLL